MGQSTHQQTPWWAIGTVALCTLLLAAGQILFKIGVEHRSDGLMALGTPIAFGLVLLVVAGLGITWALQHGDLSALYPVIALGFVWVILSGHVWFGEWFTALQAAGSVAVILGVAVIGHGSTRTRRGTRR